MISPPEFFKALSHHLILEAIDAVYQFGDLAGPALHKIADLPLDKEISAELLTCPAWSEFTALYEYAVQGFEGEDGPPLCRDFYDFLDPLRGYSVLPNALASVFFLANARLILDGHESEFEREPGVDGNCLTILEVAALADMDSRSVRNAMNQNRADRLVGEQRGTRTVISVPEARRWLAGRRGFVATTKRGPPAEATDSTLSLPKEMVAKIVTTAAKEGLSIEELISRCLTTDSHEP